MQKNKKNLVNKVFGRGATVPRNSDGFPHKRGESGQPPHCPEKRTAEGRGVRMPSPREHNQALGGLRGHTDENSGMENLRKKKREKGPWEESKPCVKKGHAATRRYRGAPDGFLF